MVKISIAGDVFVITIGSTLEDLKLLEKYKPGILQIIDDNGIVQFAVGVGSSGINAVGASFSSSTHDEYKFACMTLPIPKDIEDAEKYVTEYVAAGYFKLKKIEEKLGDALKEIEISMMEIKSIIVNNSSATTMRAGEQND